MPTANRSTSVSATSLGATVSGYLEAVASHAQATMKRVRLRITGPVSMRTQFLAGTIPLDRSCWLRLLPQELRCSLDPGLNHGPSIGPRLALASSCERIRDAIPFLPTESFRPRVYWIVQGEFLILRWVQTVARRWTLWMAA